MATPCAFGKSGGPGGSGVDFVVCFLGVLGGFRSLCLWKKVGEGKKGGCGGFWCLWFRFGDVWEPVSGGVVVFLLIENMGLGWFSW